MTYETILLNKENGVATITLNRPPMNPLNSRLFKELYDSDGEGRNNYRSRLQSLCRRSRRLGDGQLEPGGNIRLQYGFQKGL